MPEITVHEVRGHDDLVARRVNVEANARIVDVHFADTTGRTPVLRVGLPDLLEALAAALRP